MTDLIKEAIAPFIALAVYLSFSRGSSGEGTSEATKTQ